jgi:hypothetical protein
MDDHSDAPGRPPAATPRPTRRLSEALGANLDPAVRAFAQHLGKAVAESIPRDVRAGCSGIIEPEPEEGRGDRSDAAGN